MKYKEVLKKYNVSQVKLADRLGINRVSVSRLLSENNDMRASTIIKIASAIGCSPGELFDNDKKAPYSDDDTSIIIECPHCHKKIIYERKKGTDI